MTTNPDRMVALAREYQYALADHDGLGAAIMLAELLPMLDAMGLTGRETALVVDGRRYWAETTERGWRRVATEDVGP